MAPRAPHKECPVGGQRGHAPERCWTLAPCPPPTYPAPKFPCSTYPPSPEGPMPWQQGRSGHRGGASFFFPRHWCRLVQNFLAGAAGAWQGGRMATAGAMRPSPCNNLGYRSDVEYKTDICSICLVAFCNQFGLRVCHLAQAINWRPQSRISRSRGCSCDPMSSSTHVPVNQSDGTQTICGQTSDAKDEDIMNPNGIILG